jgi:serine/threonine protein kinase
LLGEIERGGMGIVYRARELHSGLLVALKMMLQSSDSASSDRQRFILEARATGELNHPGIVAIHSWGEHQGHLFYTMDFVPGVPLSRLLERGPLPCDRAVRYLLGMAQAVGAAHGLGIVHRDLKPGNIIIDLSDQPRVLDFGLAKRLRHATTGDEEAIADVLPADAPPSPTADLARRTEKGAILGTPSYMAPEQVRAEHNRVGPPADVHALGAIFYEMLSGRPPFQAESTYETLLQVVQQTQKPLRHRVPQVPAVIEELCCRCLEKEQHRRYQTAAALAEDLERRWHRAVQAGRFAWLAQAAALALLMFAGLALASRSVLAPLHPERLAQWLGDLASVSDPVRLAAPAVASLLGVAILLLAPYLAEAGLAVWLGAWAWNTDRPGRLVGGWAGAAACVLALSFCPVLGTLREGPLFLAWLLVGNALVLLVVLGYRRLSGADRPPREAHPPAPEPYLQKLFAVRVEGRAHAAMRPQGAGPHGLAEFELGKTVHRWENHEVRWARQKSLDRPTLVWLDHAPPAGGAAGVVVRHPCVLGLHAVGTGPEGSYLVTEPVPASPLAELLEQRGLVPVEAATLTAQVARAVQAFHDQGVCHGRLSAEWILVRGELEPLLCPCGFPSQEPADRARDVRALGELLRTWLPSQRRGWQQYVVAPLYQVADAAGTGAYSRPADFADDLERAVRQVRLRWRESWAHVVVLLLLAGPLLLGAVTWVLRVTEALGVKPTATVDATGSLLLALAPAAALIGYMQARGLVHRRIEGRRGSRSATGWGRPGDGVWLPLFEVLLLAAGVGVLTWFNIPVGDGRSPAAGLLLVAGEFVSFWFLGVSLAALMTFLELLLHSLQVVQPAREPAAGARTVG